MTDKTDLIREILEYVTTHGGENTATHLLVQAASAIQTQAAELEAVGAGGVQALSAAPNGWESVIDEARSGLQDSEPSAFDNSGYRAFAETVLAAVEEGLSALAASPTPQALSAEPAIKPLEWSSENEPTDKIRHNHITAETALGQFSVEWKGCKEDDVPCVYLAGDYIGVASDVDGAKQLAERHIRDIVASLLKAARTPPAEQPDLTKLTERGAKAWAGVDAQSLRDGTYQQAAPKAAPVVWLSSKQLRGVTALHGQYLPFRCQPEGRFDTPVYLVEAAPKAAPASVAGQMQFGGCPECGSRSCMARQCSRTVSHSAQATPGVQWQCGQQASGFAAPQQEAQEPCPTCVALARAVMLDQVSFDRKPDCYGIRQITDDESVEEWEDIRTSPDVAREEANDMMATGRGEIYEVVPLYAAPQPAPDCHHRPPCDECAALAAQGGKDA